MPALCTQFLRGEVDCFPMTERPEEFYYFCAEPIVSTALFINTGHIFTLYKFHFMCEWVAVTLDMLTY